MPSKVKAQSKPKPIKSPAPEAEVIDLCKKCGQHHPKCTGHKRRKPGSKEPYTPCGQAPAKGNKARKCRLHGGKSLVGIAHPNFTDGRQSKYLFLPSKNMQERAQNLAKDKIKNLDESVELAAMLESRALERLGTTESTEAWSRLKEAVKAYKNATSLDKTEQAAARAKAFGMIAFIVDEGLSESFLISDIFRAQEHQRRLTESASKVRLQNSQALTFEHWEWLLSLILKIIRQNVADRTTLTNIQRAFQAEFQSDAGQHEISGG